jgi:hypothetical protein
MCEIRATMCSKVGWRSVNSSCSLFRFARPETPVNLLLSGHRYLRLLPPLNCETLILHKRFMV